MEKCIICGNNIKNNHLFCKEHYSEIMHIINNIKNNYNSSYKISGDYFKLKNKCLNTKTPKEDIISIYQTMCALALISANDYHTNYLMGRISYELDNILDLRFGFNQTDHICDENNSSSGLTNFNDYDYRQKWPRDIQCEDGHYVRSKGEKIIDDWLYHHNIVHAYEKSVYMKSNPNDIVLSDFYIPKGDVYIEFWGMSNNTDYEERKKYKINLYNKNNYKRIDLEDTHINRIDDIMPRVLGKYNIE